MAAGVWTGVGFSNLKFFRTWIQTFWNRNGVGVWKSDYGHLCLPEGPQFKIAQGHENENSPLPKEQTWGRSKHVRRDERFPSLPQINKLYHAKWNIHAYKACALGFLLAEIRMHIPCWCLDCWSPDARHMFRLITFCISNRL